jgi:hypothetical protein
MSPQTTADESEAPIELWHILTTANEDPISVKFMKKKSNVRSELWARRMMQFI